MNPEDLRHHEATMGRTDTALRNIEKAPATDDVAVMA